MPQQNPLYLSSSIGIKRTSRGGEDFSKAKQSVYFRGIKFPPTLSEERLGFSKYEELLYRYTYYSCHFYDNFLDYEGIGNPKKVTIEINFLHTTFEHNLEFQRSSSSYNKAIRLYKCTIGNDIIFKSNFDEVILEEIEVKNIFLNTHDGLGSGNLALSGVYNKFVVRDNSQIDGIYTDNKATIKEFIIKDLGSKINDLSLNKIDIEKLFLKNIQAGKIKISNMNFLENSKVALENIIIDSFGIKKILQDSEYIKFNNIEVLEEFSCESVEFRNTYFNDFNVEGATKNLSTTSFIDSHMNNVKWGEISKIIAPEYMFRQLKVINDKHANYVEANKFYAMEMKVHEEDLFSGKVKSSRQEKFVFWINKLVSNFGQSFLRPLGWIVVFAILYAVIIYGNEQRWLENIFPIASRCLNDIVYILNYPIKNIPPLEKLVKEDFEFMSLIFYIIFSVLIWQTIVALKRYTKR